MVGPDGVDLNSYLRQVRDLALVEPSDLDRVLAMMPRKGSARDLAILLAREKLLTKYQAARILAGKGDGLRLGQYLLLEEVGRGGMGRVYRARHEVMDRQVALKVLNRRLARGQRAPELFLREVRAASKLHHPNIITAHDAWMTSQPFYLVFEFIEGPTLSELVRTRGALPVGLACEYVRQAALGLGHAHERGLVHRDIKPGNLLLKMGEHPGDAGVVKIGDFGLARLRPGWQGGEQGKIDSMELKTETVIGTPDYLSPEQAKSLQEVDGRADLYSLGCTLYFLLTGKVPFPGDNTLEKVIRHGTEPVPDPRESNHEIPIGVVEILKRLMAKSPEERPASAREVVEMLLPYVEATSITGLWEKKILPRDPESGSSLSPQFFREASTLGAPADSNTESASEFGFDELSLRHFTEPLLIPPKRKTGLFSGKNFSWKKAAAFVAFFFLSLAFFWTILTLLVR